VKGKVGGAVFCDEPWSGAPEGEARAEAAAAAGAPPGSRLEEVEARLKDVAQQMDEVTANMRRPDVTPDQLQRLAGTLTHLAQRHADLSRERERLRVDAPG
jgi:hypothetical protein